MNIQKILRVYRSPTKFLIIALLVAVIIGTISLFSYFGERLDEITEWNHNSNSPTVDYQWGTGTGESHKEFAEKSEQGTDGYVNSLEEMADALEEALENYDQ